jgi:superfamily II DNA or RNA helicase
VATAGSLGELRYRDKFRSYQLDAITMVRKYRRGVYDDAMRSGPPGAALVCHPTGTGKTAVIAGLAMCAPEIGNVLVLTTREAIRDQLVRELSGNLFIEAEKFGLSATIRLPKICYSVADSNDLASVETLFINGCDSFDGPLKAFAQRQFDRIIGTHRHRDLSTELAEGRSVVVMTVQMLLELQRRRGPHQRKVYDALSNHVDLIVFDEGHYEPAARYSEAVRQLDRPLALLSATPFRNDLKAFRIAAGNVALYKYTTAVEDEWIRKVTVVQRDPAPRERDFSDDVIQYCEGLWGSDYSAWAHRVIIHCEDAASIRRLGEAFISRGFSGRVVGIHDTFPAPQPGSWMRKSVPSPAQSEALIWIHQYKLLEGIDDYRFQVLAFFDLLKNVRSVVQQVGRVIRKGPNDDGVAWVLDHFRDQIEQSWGLYETYDASINEDQLAKTLSQQLLESFTDAQPEALYIDRKFRSLLHVRPGADEPTMTPEEIVREVLFDRRVTLRQLEGKPTLDDLSEQVEFALAEEDYEFTRYDVSHASQDTVIYLCGKVENVGFLKTRYFAAAQLEARLIMMLPKLGLVATASTGAGSGGDGLRHLHPIRPNQLQSVVTPGAHGRVSIVSSRNTNLSNRVVRRRTIAAPSIADVPPILDEHGHVVSTITGYDGTSVQVLDDIDDMDDEAFTDDSSVSTRSAKSQTDSGNQSGRNANGRPIRRYVGMSTGRISEQGPPLRVRAFRRWVESLTAQIASAKQYPELYGRYSSSVAAPTVGVAANNLLLDITDLTDEYRYAGDNEDEKEQPLASEDLCVERQKLTGTTTNPVSDFTVRLNQTDYHVTVAFNPVTQRYSLQSPEMDVDFVQLPGFRKRSIVRAFNDTQSFNIIPDDPNVIYVHGSFFAPGLKIGDRFNPDEFFVGHCLYPSPKFKDISSEKGAFVAPGDQYDPDCLFALIDGWIQVGFDTGALDLDTTWTKRFHPQPLKFHPSLAICDDMNKETADFILADEDADHRRVVMVHAKASSSYRKYSASAIQEVCAQAQKNTTLFSTYSLRKPPNFSHWDKPHTFPAKEKNSRKKKDRTMLTIKSRLRASTWPDVESAWDLSLSKLLRNPLTSKEIWIVLGNMLSAKTLAAELAKQNPNPEALQLNHLLQTTIAAGASVGAKTRIFCAP